MGSRYFLGLTLPDELSRAINSARREVSADHKIMPPLQPHITLLHPGILETLSPIYFIPKVREVTDGILPASSSFMPPWCRPRQRLEPLLPRTFSANSLYQFTRQRPRYYSVKKI